MSKVIIGIDPDSKAHGVAVYIDGKLEQLYSLPLPELVELFIELQSNVKVFELHIENVCGNNAAFKKKHVKNDKAATAVNRNIGMCQQAQIEVERMSEYYGIKVIRHKISRQWKDANGKRLFQLATKWPGRSNEDTRSAAYFGRLGLR